MKIIKQSYKIDAKPEKVFEALTNVKIIEKWSGGSAKMETKKGGRFSLWGGDIFGKNTEIVKNEKLVQEWSYKGWDKPSKVTFTLKSSGKGTTIELLQENVPDASHKSIADGWKQYYLGQIKQLLEK